MCILTASPSYLGFPLYQVARQQGSDSIWLGSPPAASRPAGLGAEGWQSLRQNGVCQTSREGTPFLAHLSISGQPGRGSAGRSVRNSSSAWPQVMVLRRALLSTVSIPCPVRVAGVPGCMSSPGKGGNSCNLLQPRAPTASSPPGRTFPGHWPLAEFLQMRLTSDLNQVPILLHEHTSPWIKLGFCWWSLLRPVPWSCASC